MNNFKKIGLTALAASLVSVSAHAGEMSVAGGASINVEGFSGEELNAGKGYTMGNQLTFSGGGELDNGLSVSLSLIKNKASSIFKSFTIILSTNSSPLGFFLILGIGKFLRRRGDEKASGESDFLFTIFSYSLYKW